MTCNEKPFGINLIYCKYYSQGIVSDYYRQWLLPSFLLDAVRLTGMDNPVLFGKFCCLAVQNKKTKVEKHIQIRGKPLSIVKGYRLETLALNLVTYSIIP